MSHLRDELKWEEERAHRALVRILCTCINIQFPVHTRFALLHQQICPDKDRSRQDASLVTQPPNNEIFLRFENRQCLVFCVAGLHGERRDVLGGRPGEGACILVPGPFPRRRVVLSSWKRELVQDLSAECKVRDLFLTNNRNFKFGLSSENGTGWKDAVPQCASCFCAQMPVGFRLNDAESRRARIFGQM